MKKILVLFIVGLSLISLSYVSAQSRSTDSSTNRTASVVAPTISGLGFSSPKPGSVFSVGDTVNIAWSIQSQGDISNVLPNLVIGYWGNGGFKVVASYVLKITDKTYAWPISYTVPPASNYQACLSFYGITTNKEACINFAIKGPVTVPVVNQSPVAVPAPANDTKNEVLGLNLKIIKPNKVTIYQGNSLDIQWGYNSQFVTDPSKQGKLTINQMVKKGWMFGMSKLEPKEIKSIMVSMGIGANTSLSLNTNNLEPGEYAVILSYQGQDTTEFISTNGYFTIIKKLPSAPSPVTAPNINQNQAVNSNSNAQNVQLINKNKLKVILVHLEQATKLLKELISE